jgi:hypothetical protein
MKMVHKRRAAKRPPFRLVDYVLWTPRSGKPFTTEGGKTPPCKGNDA